MASGCRCSRCRARSRPLREVSARCRSAGAGRRPQAGRPKRRRRARRHQPRGAAARAGAPQPRPARGATAPRPTAREQRNRADENWDVRVPVKAGERERHGRVSEEERRRSTRRCGCRSCARIRPATTSPSRAWARRCEAWKSAARIRPGARRRHAEPPAHLRLPAAGGRRRRPMGAASAGRSPAPGRSCRRWRRAYRRPVTDADSRRCWRSTTRGERRADSKRASSGRLKRLLVSPEFLYRVEVDPPNVAAEHRLPHQRPRAGVAAVVLPLEQHPRRRAARRRGERAAAERRRAGAAGAAHDGRPAVRRARRRTSPGSGCSCATCR